ncbi:aldo/keto reductase [Limibacter armeniacum]|uniref:aldo/keto reductase n=1 Tax=Limibacter armeniacum TaxID=466084 RepID=UPI002FE64977
MAAKRIQLSKTGPEFSRVAAGVWKWDNLNTQQIDTLVKAGIESGITTFDHADIYGSYTCEEAFGKVLRQDSSLRDKIELVSKCGIKLLSPNRPDHKVHSYDTSKSHIVSSVENSLKMLETEYLDLLLIHRPDPLMHPDEIAEAFYQLQKSGKVLHFGVSNFTPSQFEMLNSRFTLVTNQVEISALHRDTIFDGTLDQCIQHSIVPMAWSPLGSGQIFTETDDPTVRRLRDKVIEIATNHNNAGIDQILLAWLMKHPSQILPILGTSKPERIKAAADAIDIDLSRDEWFEILVAAQGHPIP